MVNLILTGRIPSKKNQKIIVCRGKFPQVLPSKKYSEWHDVAMVELMTQKPPKGISNCQIEAKFYFPDNRAADLSNKFESVADLLVDYGVLTDDSWQVMYKVTLASMGVDKEKPRCEITIDYE